MARRATVNKTNIPRIKGVIFNDAWVHYVCIRCGSSNTVRIGKNLLTPTDALETQAWECVACKFIHSKSSPLPKYGIGRKHSPFYKWKKKVIEEGSLPAQRFWQAFFKTSTESPEAYWKQCGTCGRILPHRAFSRHVGWGPLAKQIECRDCKAVINTSLNPKRTKEQLHESSSRRRTADLLLVGSHERIDPKELFKRFGSKCFKTNRVLKMGERSTWAIDHILPSRWLYPLTTENAALLSKEANDNKNDRWPRDFYTNEQLKRLAQITGSNLSLIASKTPVVNKNIDVNACVTRMLKVREATDLTKRIKDLKKLLDDYKLVYRLSKHNKKILGYF